MKSIILLISVATFLLASEYSKGKSIYFQNACSNCHGINAEGSGNNPRLANKSQSDIIKKLKTFQKGKANSQAGEIMFEFARRLDEEKINSVSYFLSNHKKDTSTNYEISDDILGSVD